MSINLVGVVVLLLAGYIYYKTKSLSKAISFALWTFLPLPICMLIGFIIGLVFKSVAATMVLSIVGLVTGCIIGLVKAKKFIHEAETTSY